MNERMDRIVEEHPQVEIKLSSGRIVRAGAPLSVAEQTSKEEGPGQDSPSDLGI